MLTSMNPELRRAVSKAVDLVNARPGQTCVHLRFHSQELPELEILANAATLQGEDFAFTSGFESVNGTIGELAGIRTEILSH